MTKKRTAIKSSKGDAAFDVFVTVFMLIFLFIMLYPLYFTVIASFSDINEVGLGRVYLWPKGFNLDAYRNVINNKEIWRGYVNTIYYVTFGTIYALAIMLPLSYALSKKHLFGSVGVNWFFLFTMYFSGGLVPNYLLRRDLNLINNPLVMIIGGISVYNMIVTRTFFQNSIPNELYESAKIDGANEFTCFFKIAIPLSSAIIAVMALYNAVSGWNAYFGALIYFTKPNLYPLQLVLRQILIENQRMSMDIQFFNTLTSDQQQLAVMQARMAEAMKYSVVFIASAPLLIAYPFVQKFFVKGVMIGSLKG